MNTSVTRQRPRLSSKNMPPSVDGRAIGRAGGLYENFVVVFEDYLDPLDKSLSSNLLLKNWRPPWRPSWRGRLWPMRRGSWLTQTPSTEHAKKNYVYPDRELDYGMVPTGLANSDDCPIFKERERPTSCEQLSPYCSYVRHREIAWATHCQSPFLVVGGEVAPQPVASRVPQALMYHRTVPQIVSVHWRWLSVDK